MYPNGETAFKGHFENKIMKKTWNVNVLAYECDKNSGLMIGTYVLFARRSRATYISVL